MRAEVFKRKIGKNEFEWKVRLILDPRSMFRKDSVLNILVKDEESAERLAKAMNEINIIGYFIG